MMPQKLMYENGPYRSILVACPDSCDQLFQYQLERLIRFRPDWLIPGFVRHRGGKAQICLDTTGLKPLDETFSAAERTESLGRDILRAICLRVQSGADLLLPAAQFSLHPSYVYLNPAGAVCLAFWPFLESGEASGPVTEPWSELSALAAFIGGAFCWSEIAIERAVAAARSGPETLLDQLRDEVGIPAKGRQPTQVEPTDETDPAQDRQETAATDITATSGSPRQDPAGAVGRRRFPAGFMAVLLLHGLAAAAAVLWALGHLDPVFPLLLPAAIALLCLDAAVLLHRLIRDRHLPVGRFWSGLFGNTSQGEDNGEGETDQTVLLTPAESDFRMAMLSEGEPGTPAEHEGQRAFILVEAFVIGRDPKKTDLCLQDHSIGRMHARIIRRAGSFFICDLGSGNGTQLDGKRLPRQTECLLPDRCILRFADRSFYFQTD